MHPLFFTLSNIYGEVRMKATTHAWSCAAFMPIPKFDVHPDYQTVLAALVWHMCMDKITTNLKTAARSGEYMPDPSGQIRWGFTPLVAWTADLPEQQLISAVAKSGSPWSLASTKEFGDSSPHTPRHGSHTLQTLYDISQSVDPWDIHKFQAECKKHNLLGVNLPFWRDWHLSEPSVFLVPEILHSCHKFFFDHPLNWCKNVVGKAELDARYRALPTRVGVRHFTKGVSHVDQMTGREHREIQKTIVANIAGAAPPAFVRAIRHLIDFIYQAQSPRHTDMSVATMAYMLQQFHAYKNAVLEAHA
jgi:hypothetical protein